MNETPFDQFLDFLFSVQIWGVAKLLALVGLLLYLVFAIVIIRQVNLMSRVLNGALDLPLKLIAWIHFGLALAVLVLAMIIL